MAISTTYDEIGKKFNPRMWDNVDEFVEFYLLRLSEKNADTNYYTDKNGEEQVIPPINHYPELKEYEVWMTGFAATGQSAKAHLLGKAKARNFAEACHKVVCEKYLENIKETESDPKTQYGIGRWDYNGNELTYWGCELYWSEELARKSFG